MLNLCLLDLNYLPHGQPLPIGYFCLCTPVVTHLHELTLLADEVTTVTTRHVTVITTEGALTLFYKIKSGVCDRSFGVHVAEMVQFPQGIIDTARRKADELELAEHRNK